MMLEEYGQHLAQFLTAHPNWGGFITFAVAFTESLAIIGTIVPGSITMTAIGLLVGTGIMPLGSTLFWAMLGAFLGDLLGYWIGAHYNERLRNMWPFRNRPNWLASGEKFFQKHGGKSIIIGRFFGPVRSLIPLVAGLLRMPLQRFILAALPSAALWALMYMFPGILIGALSLNLPPGMATRFILLFLLILILLTVVGWSFKHIFLFINRSTDLMLQKVWLRIQKQPRARWIQRLIAIQQQPHSHTQLGLLLLAFIGLLGFVFIFISIKLHTMLFLLNLPTHELLRSLRHAPGDKVMMAFTLLGSGFVLFPAGFIILLWLAWQKKWRAALHWAVVLCLGFIVPLIFKHFIYSARPTGLLHGPTTNSFPSGHTFLSVMYFGFLAGLCASHLKNGIKTIPYYIALFVVVLVALSRVYLGVHWLTDVLGSMFFGIFCYSLALISYRRNITQELNINSFAIITVGATLLTWIVYSVPHYHKMLIDHTPIWPETILTFEDWWGQTSQAIPLYRTNRLGTAAEPMNIQWLGDVEKICATLRQQGWQRFVITSDLSYIIAKVAKNNKFNPVTLFGIYYNNSLPIAMLAKHTNNHKQWLVLRLWLSNVNFLDTRQTPLLLGILAVYDGTTKSKHRIKYKNVLEKVIPDLQDFRYQIQNVPVVEQSSLSHPKWDNRLLQIKSPTGK